jgi:ubiquinone/menaquinone biosynthesis C-methylase UbiE
MSDDLKLPLGTRDIDNRFLTISAQQRFKHYFSFVIEEGLKKKFSPASGGSLLEIGCARGDFLRICRQHFSHLQLTGLDIRDDLLTLAAAESPGITFRQGDILSLPEDIVNFDCCCVLTVHSLFDDIEKFLLPVIRTVKKGGTVLIFGLFNPADLDVLVRIRSAREPETGYQSGWNIHSELTVGSILKKHNHSFSFIRYAPPEPKTSDDGGNFSSWTEELANGTLHLVNGAQIIHKFALLEIVA